VVRSEGMALRGKKGVAAVRMVSGSNARYPVGRRRRAGECAANSAKSTVRVERCNVPAAAQVIPGRKAAEITKAQENGPPNGR